METRYIELGLGKRYGFVTDMERRTGVKRATMNGWFQRSSTPRLDALEPIARVLQVARADLVAAFDGTPRDQPLPDILSDAERRLRRKWWLWVARATAGLSLRAAREQLAARGFQSSRGNLVSLWEDPGNRLEPTKGQVRALADMYRVPLEAMVSMWNNPPETDEEQMAGIRGARLEAIDHDDVEVPAEREPARRTA